MRLIVGMTGATGAPLGVALLHALRAIPDVETHLVMSKWAKNHYRTGDALHARRGSRPGRLLS
ncbi:decarboxylase [Salmonella enterica subsp. salamae]|nr:decarboxylase [Salmonella enterica subsp. salamae]